MTRPRITDQEFAEHLPGAVEDELVMMALRRMRRPPASAPSAGRLSQS